MTLDVAGHYHRPDLFSFGVRRGTRPREPQLETKPGA